MNEFDGYQTLASRTASRKSFQSDMLHAALGLSGEAGEFADAIKKHTVYNQDLDVNNVLEEIGDLLWYCAYACTVLNVSMAEVAELNIRKLSARYPDKYSDHHASQRLDKKE
jgi:NTP pyrophosphatase (non-canonical NTP hydrolase)